MQHPNQKKDWRFNHHLQAIVRHENFPVFVFLGPVVAGLGGKGLRKRNEQTGPAGLNPLPPKGSPLRGKIV